MTVEAYVKYNTFTGNSRIINFFDGPADDDIFLCEHDATSTVKFRVFVDGSEKTQKIDNFFETGIWVHVVATVDDTTMKLYKNGTLTDTGAGKQEPANLTRVQHWIGRSWFASNGYFDGTIAYLRFWHGEALDADQVAQLYAERSGTSALRNAER